MPSESLEAPAPAAVYAEDLLILGGLKLGCYVVTQDSIVDFARQWDPQFFHVDPDRAASEGHFGGLIASGLQTLGIYQRLWTEQIAERWRIIAGAGLSDVRFHRPVRPNDRLTGRASVMAVDLQPGRRRGLARLAGELVNQNGDEVLSLSSSVYLEMRTS